MRIKYGLTAQKTLLKITINHIFCRACENLTAEVKQEKGEKGGTLIPISFVKHVLINYPMTHSFFQLLSK